MTEGNTTSVNKLGDILWIVITLVRLSKRSTRNNLKNMNDEQIEQHIGMEGGGQHLKMLNENKIKQPKQLTMENKKL